jgi:hypothetical protein
MKFSRVRFRNVIVAASLCLAMQSATVWAKDAVAVKVDKPASFKGVTQVVIGQFTVAYFVKKVDYDGGGFLATSAKGKAIGHLSGLSSQDYQLTTDAIFADFKKQLADQGISIVDPAGLTADRYYAKVKPETQGGKVDVILKKEDHADALAYWPTSLGRTDNALLPMRMMDMNLSHNYTAQYNYARTAKVPVLNVVYFVDFAKPATSSGGGLLQSVKVKAGLAMSQFGTQIALMDTTGKLAKISLSVPIEEGGDFADIRETTSTATKVMKVASVLGAMKFGGSSGGMSARFDYQVTDSAAYSEKALSAATKTSDLLLRQIVALR